MGKLCSYQVKEERLLAGTAVVLYMAVLLLGRGRQM